MARLFFLREDRFMAHMYNQRTMRFERAELQRLAIRSRPFFQRFRTRTWVAAAVALGAVVVLLARGLA